MKLKIIKRVADKKKEINTLRREGFIPAVMYQRGKNAESIAVYSTDFESIKRTVVPGRLSTHKFVLTDSEGNERQAVLKEIQYEITTYKVIHLDFEELIEDQPINIKVPIECTGMIDCVGIKLGGVLRRVIPHLRVRCLPKDIPAVFCFDVKNMMLGESYRLNKLEIPNTIRPLADLKEVAVAIVKR